MRSNSSLQSLPDPLRPGMVAPDSVLSMGQMEINCLLIQNWTDWNITVFDIETVIRQTWIVWIRTVWKNWIACKRNIFDN